MKYQINPPPQPNHPHEVMDIDHKYYKSVIINHP